MKFTRAHLLFLSLVLCTGLNCEDPFSTREPEPPEEQGGSTFINPSSPDVVFINVQLAFSEKNVENYIRSFVDSTRSARRFLFVPDVGVVANRAGILLNWTLEEERRYLSQVFQATPQDSLVSIQFFEENRTQTTNTAILTHDYSIFVNHTRKDEQVPVEFKGQAKFWLEQNEIGNWAIYRWEDFSNRVDPPWSELKAFFK
jgi:hypothetical protein